MNKRHLLIAAVVANVAALAVLFYLVLDMRAEINNGNVADASRTRSLQSSLGSQQRALETQIAQVQTCLDEAKSGQRFSIGGRC